MPPRKPRILLEGKDPNELMLSFAGNIVKHLGVQMYAGRPVPAIAELVSNAWDADATKVNISVPLGVPWRSSNKRHVIKVEDNGIGMTWDMIRDSYLDVGRDRREAEGTDRSPSGRPLQGRKGIGKLAGFGISDFVEVQTVHKDVDPTLKKRILVWFGISLEELRKVQKGPAKINLFYAGPVDKGPARARVSKGTTVTLRQLHPRKAQSADRFHASMAQRFLFYPKFRVTVNKEDLRPEHIQLQWRWPKRESTWKTESVPGCGLVRYWIGFTPKPRKQDEGELSGILVYTRSKVSQEATFFDISGGVTGQHGLRYMVGMVRAEWLDSGIDEPDLIATHRGSIAWESPKGQAFQKWGQTLVKKYLSEWAKLRSELRQETAIKLNPQIMTRISQLPSAYQDVALGFVKKFHTLEMEVSEFEELLSWFLAALENVTLRRIIEKIRGTDLRDLGDLDRLLSKMEIRTAVALLQIINSNLAAIETLERLHAQGALERGVISKHLQRNPWLIHPTWLLNKAEAQVDKWIEEEFGIKGPKKNRDRVDFFCVGVNGVLHIVEIKRGKHIARLKDFHQADRYRQYVLKRFEEIGDPEAPRYKIVQSHLIASKLHSECEDINNAFRDKGWVIFTPWSVLIEQAKLSHYQFRQELEKAVRQPDSEAEPLQS